MNHTQSLDFRGDLAAAFALAASTLTACGFKLVNKTARSLEFTGPGTIHSQGSALLGASRITITGGGGRIELEAELGGHRRLMAVVGLVIAVAIAQAVVFGTHILQSSQAIDWVRMLPFVILSLVFGVVVGPLGGRFLRQRTTRALDTLLNNMAMSGKDT